MNIHILCQTIIHLATHTTMTLPRAYSRLPAIV
jgi:hypothetical protein